MRILLSVIAALAAIVPAVAGSGPKAAKQLPAARLAVQARAARPATSRLASHRPDASFEATAPQPAATALRVPGTNTTLGAAMVYSDLWGVTDSAGHYLYPITAGIYTIQAKEGGGESKVYQNNDFTKMRAGVKVNNTYYVVSASATGETAYVSEYSTLSWSRNRNEQTDVVNVPTDLTYDPTTGKVYGVFYDSDNDEYDRFGTYSLTLGEATEIALTDRRVFALACNKAGELYGIWGYTGWLIKIDKKTGKYEQIGKTGVYPEYNNTMTFGSDGVLYWAATDEKGKSALYSVNTATGAATKIRDFENNAGFAGLYEMPEKVPDSAPEAVTGLAVDYTSPMALTAKVSFTAPTKSVGGSQLTAPISAIVSINGTQAAVVDGITPGAKAETQVLNLTAGLQKVEVTTADAEFRGATASITSWAGEDVPGTPQGLSIALEGGYPLIKWSAPTKGVNGGDYDRASLRYKVVRYPGAATVTESLTDTTLHDTGITAANAAVYYEVSAVTNKGASQPATTDKVVVGRGYEVPFVETFDTQDAFDLWSVTDLNGGSTWQFYNHCAQYKYNNENLPGDDWLISPQIALKKGVNYRLTFKSQTFSTARYVENFKVAIGASGSPASMKELKAFTDYSCPKGEVQRVVLKVEEDGYYHLGFYCFSDGKKGWLLKIDSVGMAVVSSRVPAAVTGLTVTPAAKGELKAAIAFTAPATDADGGKLDQDITVSVYRDEAAEPAYTATVTPGAKVEWTDAAVAASGLHTYRVTASNEAGDGPEEKATAFIGTDVPGAVTGLTITDQGSSALIGWTAPQSGAQGGYFDPATVTYRIVRSDGTVVAEALAATTFTDSNLPTATSQQLIYYVVTPYSGTSKGAYAVTPYCVLGTPYQAPLTEGFAGSDMKYYPWVTESDADMHQSWTLEDAGQNPATADQNSDKGLVTFHSVGENAGIHASFSSPKISLDGLDSPGLSFWMYHSHVDSVATAESIEVRVLASGKAEWQSLEHAKWMRDNGSTGWQRHSADLSAFKGCKWIRIALVGTTAAGLNVHIDNISVANVATTDVEASALSGPKRIAAGEKARYELAVTNTGTQAASGVTATLYGPDGATLATAAIGAMAAGEQQKVNLTATLAKLGATTVKATVACDGDANSQNNSLTATTTVVKPVIPVPQALACEENDGGVKLSWQSPMSRGAVTDDVESYTDWAIDGVGEWTMADLDHDVTYRINKDLDKYPHESEPKAFQVCNANTLGIDIWEQGKTHSGNKMFMAISSVNMANNDWLISPQLNGGSQTISFWAKSFTTDDTPMERMRVLYSTTDTDPTHFTPLHAAPYIELPEQWGEFSYTLPAGARYFAVNCVSSGAFAMFVDDLSFNDLTVPQLAVQNYEVYRNGEKIGTTAGTEFTDATSPATLSGAVYKVRANYDGNRQSGFSEAVTFQPSGIDAIDGQRVSIAAHRGAIVVNGAEGLAVAVHRVDGVAMYATANAEPSVTIPASAGVYLVTVATRTVKVVVP